VSTGEEHEGPGGAGFKDIFDLTFSTYVTPTVVRVIYILVIVFGALWWVALVIASLFQNPGAVLAALILGGIAFVIGVLMWRVFLELVMVIFSIKDNTERMAEGSGGAANQE